MFHSLKNTKGSSLHWLSCQGHIQNMWVFFKSVCLEKAESHKYKVLSKMSSVYTVPVTEGGIIDCEFIGKFKTKKLLTLTVLALKGATGLLFLQEQS